MCWWRSFDLDLAAAAVEESIVVGAVAVAPAGFLAGALVQFTDGARGALPCGSGVKLVLLADILF